MFETLGRKLDRILFTIKEWNYGRVWYKLYGHIFIIYKIRTKGFDGRESFEWFMDTVLKNNQIYKWQYERLVKQFDVVYTKEEKQ